MPREAAQKHRWEGHGRRESRLCDGAAAFVFQILGMGQGSSDMMLHSGGRGFGPGLLLVGGIGTEGQWP